MDEKAVLREEDHVVVRSARGRANVGGAEAGDHLVRTSSSSGERQATGERAADGDVNVSEKDVPHAAAMAAQESQIRLRVRHADVVEVRRPRERRMMLEQHDRPVAGFVETLLAATRPRTK
jgi:hypothetical protein